MWLAGFSKRNKMFNSRRLLWLGFILVLLGFVIPFLIVIKILPSTFFLNFFAFGASVAGLYLGIIGASGLYVERKHKNRWMQEDWINSDRD